MTTMRARELRLPSVLLALALVASLSSTASAQSQLDSSQATAFLGTWSLSFDSPQGTLVIQLEIADSSGTVAASIGSEMMGGGMQEVTDVTRSGESLVLSYELDAQGQLVPVALTLAPDGNATMDFASGAFTMGGQGTKSP
ncbi:MAG: hypothetical protein ABL963_12140 [Longimicrobiales bacterium]